MSDATQSLSSRIRELRRRHFGPRGAARFAEQLGVSADDYARFERGTIPPGELLVRMCDSTGEDLQWLLTGVAARGSVVITGARTRHQQLLTRIAALLDENPHFASPIESFLDLLSAGPAAGAATARESAAGALIPILRLSCLAEHPRALLEQSTARELAHLGHDLGAGVEHRAAEIDQPAARRGMQTARKTELLVLSSADGPPQTFLNDDALGEAYPDALGVWIDAPSLEPLFAAGEAAIVSLGSAPSPGNAVLCRVDGDDTPRCRIWLAEHDGVVELGSVLDGSVEQLDAPRVLWAFPVLARLRVAA